MAAERQEKKRKSGSALSRTGLFLGAAGLLLFIVGLKRSYQLDEEHTVSPEAGKKRRDGE